jgi:cytochrome c peroxidase
MFKSTRAVKFVGFHALIALGLAGCGNAGPAPTEGSAPEVAQVKQALSSNLSSATQKCSQDSRVTLGVVSLDVCVGAELFFRDTFGGNGRSCGSCHPANNNYSLDPAFIATLPSSDPLVVAENDPALSQLERPDLMHQHALIVENVDGAEDPTQKFSMRSEPHCLGLSRSIQAPSGTTAPPLERTGWSGDGAPNQGRLEDFQTGAIFQHYTKTLNRTNGVDFVQANADELAAIDAFLKTIGRTNELDLTTVSMTDPGAEAGRTTFIPSRCNGCHHNAGANTAADVNQLFDTGVEKSRLPELNAQGIPHDGGFGGQGLASFNHDADGDGILDSFGDGTFNTPPLIEAADTGPFFHTNAFNTIEDAIGFYNTAAFNQSPAGLAGAPIDFNATQVANLGRFLRVLNAALNAQMAIARIDALTPIIDADKNKTRDLQQQLAQLALEEVNDALSDLSAVANLNAVSQASLTSARASLQTAATHASFVQRGRAAADARSALVSANAGLGSGMTFVMGPGTDMF